MQEIKEAQVQSLGWEDPLQQEMVIHWVFLTEKSHGQTVRLQRVGDD